MKRSPLFRLVLVSLVTASTSCKEEAPSRLAESLVPPVVTDSAGIRIVENRIPPTGVPLYATVDSMPSLDIGQPPGGDPHFILSGVVSAATLSDGRVVVASGGASELSFYLGNGRYLRSAGGGGDEAGKFRSLTRMGRYSGDTLWVFDTRADRLSLLDPDARITRTIQVSGASPWGRFGDGSFLLVPPWAMDTGQGRIREGLRRDTATYLRWWPATGDTAVVGGFPQDEIVVVDTGGASMAAVPPFGRRTTREVGPGRFYVGDETSFDVRGYDPDGTLREIIRLAGVDLTLPPAEVEETHKRMAAGKTEPAWGRKFWDAVPATRPAYSRFLLDAAGNLWVAEYVSVTDFPRNWMVFRPDGALSGLVEMPPHFTPYEIGVSYILGMGIEAPGVEHVRRYGLKRGT